MCGGDVIKAKWRNREGKRARQTDRQRDKDFPTAPISNLNACVISSRGFYQMGDASYGVGMRLSFHHLVKRSHIQADTMLI